MGVFFIGSYRLFYEILIVIIKNTILKTFIIFIFEISLCCRIYIFINFFLRTCNSFKKYGRTVTWDKIEIRHFSRNQNSLSLSEFIIFHISLTILICRRHLNGSTTLDAHIYDEALELIHIYMERI